MSFASSFVLNREEPVNLMIIAQSGAGKTRLLLETLEGVEGVRYLPTLRQQQFFSILKKIAHDEVTTLAFGEFNKVVAGKESSVANITSSLNQLISEGLDSFPLANSFFYFKRKLYAQEFIGVTSETVDYHLPKWWRMGFLQRHIIVSYKYTDEQIRGILENTAHTERKKFERLSKLEKQNVRIPKKYNDELADQAVLITKSLEEYCTQNLRRRRILKIKSNLEILPFRTHNQLRGLAMGSALDKGRTVVTREDVERVIYATTWINMNHNYLE